jgi:hypothetical protein
MLRMNASDKMINEKGGWIHPCCLGNALVVVLHTALDEDGGMTVGNQNGGKGGGRRGAPWESYRHTDTPRFAVVGDALTN